MNDQPTQPIPPLSAPSPGPVRPPSVQFAGVRVPRKLVLASAGALVLLLCACVGSGILLGAAGTIVYNGLRLPVAASAPTATDTIAATDTLVAFPTSTHLSTIPTVTSHSATGSGGNPWGYNFSCCQLIYVPSSSFCAYFACIANFWNGQGYVVECRDTLFSKSGGISGACSYHGGEWRPLYAPSPGGNPTATATPSLRRTPTPTTCVARVPAAWPLVIVSVTPGVTPTPTATGGC